MYIVWNRVFSSFFSNSFVAIVSADVLFTFHFSSQYSRRNDQQKFAQANVLDEGYVFTPMFELLQTTFSSTNNDNM